jgi:hypothetical protein
MKILLNHETHERHEKNIHQAFAYSLVKRISQIMPAVGQVKTFIA